MTDKLNTSAMTTTVIDADSRIPLFNIRLLWEYRELLAFMIWRDWSVRYKQTALGFSWVILQPIATTIIFSVVFGLFARIPTDIPYPIFFLTGLVPYRVFSDALTSASNSLTQNAHLVNKVYFPRIIMPIAAVVTTLSDFVFAFGVLLVSMLLFGLNPFTLNILMIPIFVLLALITASGLGLWFAAMNVRYRDVGQILPFVLQVMLYASPVIYPISAVQDAIPRWVEVIYSLNPMVSVIEGFRWSLVGSQAPDATVMLISSIGALLLLLSGLVYFNRMERTFGDII